MVSKAGWAVYGGMAFAIAYLFMEWYVDDAVNRFFPIAGLAAALFFFHQSFVDKSEVKERPPIQMGPPEPFVGQEQWTRDRNGNPVQVRRPPMQPQRQYDLGERR
jgi:hypothetical protein